MSAPYAAGRPKPSQPNEFRINLLFYGTIIGVAVVVAFVIVPVALTAVLVFALVKATGVKWWWIALLAFGLFLVMGAVDHSPLEDIEHAFRKAHTIAERRGFDIAVKRIWNHKENWWSLTIPAAIPIGGLIGSLMATMFDRQFPWWDPRIEVQKSAEIQMSRQGAAKRAHKAPDAIKGLGVLGPFAHGDLGAPWMQRFRRSRFLCFHPVLLGRHVVVVGKPGSGKTVTLLRLAYIAAKVFGWRVYFLDGKGDEPTMREFVGLMLAAGVPSHLIGAFPTQPFDGWRTRGDFDQGYSQLLNRLMGALSFTEPYYRDSTRRYLAQALRMNGRLPRSSPELLERLAALAEAAPPELKREARSTHARYQSFFDSFSGQLDDGWSFSDCHAGYVLLRGLSNPDEAKNVAAYLFECFKQFATDMKHRDERVLLIVDEFPALMGDSDAAGMIERLRSFGCGVALSGQSYGGLGPDRGRIVEAAGALILHRLSDSDDLAKLAGTIQAYSVTTQVDFDDHSTGRGTVTPEHRFKVEPNLVGRQRDGEIMLIADRCAAQGHVSRTEPDRQLLETADQLLGQMKALHPARDMPPDDDPPGNVIELR